MPSRGQGAEETALGRSEGARTRTRRGGHVAAAPRDVDAAGAAGRPPLKRGRRKSMFRRQFFFRASRASDTNRRAPWPTPWPPPTPATRDAARGGIVRRARTNLALARAPSRRGRSAWTDASERSRPSRCSPRAGSASSSTPSKRAERWRRARRGASARGAESCARPSWPSWKPRSARGGTREPPPPRRGWDALESHIRHCRRRSAEASTAATRARERVASAGAASTESPAKVRATATRSARCARELDAALACRGARNARDAVRAVFGKHLRKTSRRKGKTSHDAQGLSLIHI